MNNISEEYTRYYELSKEKEELNTKLASIAYKNDSDSIKTINEIAGELNKINNLLSRYDDSLLEITSNYYSGLDEVHKLTEDINLIEKISKKTNGEKVQVVSADGRKKMIDKEYELEYKSLCSRKKELRKNNLDNYNALKNITSIMKETSAEEVKQDNASLEEFVFIETKGYDELPLEEKIKMTEERLDRIFESRYLPNMGKKILVTYNGNKYYIPKIYAGRFNDTVRELNTLMKKKNNFIEEKTEVIKEPIINEDIYFVSLEKEIPDKSMTASETKDYSRDRVSLPVLNEIVDNNKIVLHPVDVTFMSIPKVSLSKAFVGAYKRINIDKLKKILPSIYNIDKKAELSFKKMESKLLDRGIKIKSGAVIIADKVVLTYNTTKNFVTSVPKRVSGYVTDKYSELKKFLNEKERLVTNVKYSGSIKESMEKIYGEDKDSHLDYRIVNRAVKFKDNTCQKIDETKGNIAKVSKSVIDKIKEPFDRLKENMKNDIERKNLEKEIAIVKQDILMKKDELRRIKRMETVRTNSGYIAMSGLIIVGTILVAVAIFTMINGLLR